MPPDFPYTEAEYSEEAKEEDLRSEHLEHCREGWERRLKIGEPRWVPNEIWKPPKDTQP